MPQTFSWTIAVSTPPITSTAASATTPAPVRDLLLGPDGDLVIVNGDLQLVSGVQAIAQSVGIALRMLQGEWFDNPAAGVPWFQQILGKKNVSIPLVRQVLSDAILGVEGITGVTTMNVTLTGRQLQVSFIATSDLGLITGSGGNAEST